MQINIVLGRSNIMRCIFLIVRYVIFMIIVYHASCAFFIMENVILINWCTFFNIRNALLITRHLFFMVLSFHYAMSLFENIFDVFIAWSHFSLCNKNWILSISFLRIWSHLLKKSLIENFIFCAVHISIGSCAVLLTLLDF